MVSDRERRELFEALNLSLGDGPAATLMELLPPVGWADVARQPDLVAIRGEMAGLRADLQGEMAELRTELKGEMSELRSELKGEMAQLRVEMADLRTELCGEMADLRTELKGEMAGLRAHVDAQLPRFLFANVPIMFGVAGLVLAAAKLA